MVVVRRPGYRLGRIIRGELKPLHPWDHLYWFLFGFSLCECWSLSLYSLQSLLHRKRISYTSNFVFSMLVLLSALILESYVHLVSFSMAFLFNHVLIGLGFNWYFFSFVGECRN